MSLYYLQKLLFNLNRDPRVRARYLDDPDEVLVDYRLDETERDALARGDIGRMYVMGVNGQLLMHYAAMLGYEWPDYIAALKDALDTHGNPRAGLYRTTDGKGAL